jgi:hypothetical protein
VEHGTSRDGIAQCDNLLSEMDAGGRVDSCGRKGITEHSREVRGCSDRPCKRFQRGKGKREGHKGYCKH